MVKFRNADIFGRIGTGIGQGLAQQLPEEIMRGRTQHGLQQLERDAPNLNLAQQGARLLTIPGLTPQGIQTMGELLKQQGITQGLRNVAAEQPQQPTASQILRNEPQAASQTSPTTPGQKPEARGYATPEQTAAAIRPYIPRTLPELQTRAAELAEQNPQLYPTAKEALAGAIQEDQALQNQSAAQQQARKSAIDVENRVRQGLEALKVAAGANIPDRINQEIENDVLDKIEGGMDELQAIKKGQEKQHEISQKFEKIKEWGSLRSAWTNKDDFRQSIRSAQRDAKKGKYQKEAAEYMVAHNKVTPQFAFSLMNPVSDYPELNKVIKSMPTVTSEILKSPQGTAGFTGMSVGATRQLGSDLTRRELSRLAEAMGTEASPLAIMQELEKKGYDGQLFKKYLLDHEAELNLTNNQKNELQTPKPMFYGLLNDLFLKDFSGVE